MACRGAARTVVVDSCPGNSIRLPYRDRPYTHRVGRAVPIPSPRSFGAALCATRCRSNPGRAGGVCLRRPGLSQEAYGLTRAHRRTATHRRRPARVRVAHRFRALFLRRLAGQGRARRGGVPGRRPGNRQGGQGGRPGRHPVRAPRLRDQPVRRDGHAPRRPDDLSLAPEPHPRHQPPEPHRRRPARRDQPGAAERARPPGFFLCPGPRQPEGGDPGRQRGGKLGRPALPEIRGHDQPRARPGDGSLRRRGGAPGRSGPRPARLRPAGAHHRQRGDAGRRDRDHGAHHAQAGKGADAAGGLRCRRGRRPLGGRHHRRRDRAGDARDDGCPHHPGGRGQHRLRLSPGRRGGADHRSGGARRGADTAGRPHPRHLHGQRVPRGP